MTRPGDGMVDDQTLGRWVVRRLRAVWPVIALTVAIVAAAALTAARSDSGLPLDPGSRRPDGTAALADVLAALDQPARIVAPDEIGEADVVLLLRDQLDDAQRARLEARVGAGARVVVTDPTSPLAPEPADQVGLLDRTLAAGCAEPAIADARAVRPAGGALYEVAGDATGCFGDDAGAWLVVTPMGRGNVIALGGPQVLTNRGLGDADHAVLAAQLLTPAGSGPPTIVRPVVPAAGDGQAGLGTLVPTGVRIMVLQLLLAFVVVVAWRARRLGQPLVDRSPVRLASSELTSAVGALFARNGARAATSRRIADDTRARIARRLGLPASADTDAVAAAVAARTGGDAGATTAVLDPPPPRDDRGLLAVSTELSTLETQVHTVTAPGWRSTDVD